MVRFVLDDDKVYKVVAESDDAIWVIDYDNPCAPKMVKQDGLVNLEEIPVPDDYMQESVVSRAIYDTAKKRLGILSAILSDNAYITNAALRQRAIAKVATMKASVKKLKRILSLRPKSRRMNSRPNWIHRQRIRRPNSRRP